MLLSKIHQSKKKKKKTVTPESKDCFIQCEVFRTLSSGGRVSGSPEKLLQGGRERSQVILKFVMRGAGSLKIKDYC